MNNTRLTFKVMIVLGLCLIFGRVYAADPWPNHPIKFVVGFGPGGANDTVARVVAEAASKQLGQPIIVLMQLQRPP